jgi:hypothetical protein
MHLHAQQLEPDTIHNSIFSLHNGHVDLENRHVGFEQWLG